MRGYSRTRSIRVSRRSAFQTTLPHRKRLAAAASSCLQSETANVGNAWPREARGVKGRVIRTLHDARAGDSDRAAPRERVSAAPADAATLLRLGEGTWRDPPDAPGAAGADGRRVGCRTSPAPTGTRRPSSTTTGATR